jgi:fatty acid/phospholipid biosynthesis enzyme
MRIAIDAVGGDNAPDAIIAGVLESVEELEKDDELILVGPEDIIESQLKSQNCHKGDSEKETQKLNCRPCQIRKTRAGRRSHFRRQYRGLCCGLSNEDEEPAGR